MQTVFIYGDALIGGKHKNMYSLDTSRARTQGARLVTPYYPSGGKVYACLTLEWYSYGTSQQTISITQQDKRDTKLWWSTDKSADWQTKRLNIDLRSGDPRFFIEVQFSPNTNGAIAVDKLRLDYNIC